MANTPINPDDRAATPDFRLLFESLPGAYLVLDRDLHIRAASEDFLASTMTVREEILGRLLFEVFPDNPDDPESKGSQHMRASSKRVLELGVADVMPLARHDVPRPPPDTGFEERYWSPTNTPVLDADGKVAYILHHVEDVTEYVKLCESRDRSPVDEDSAIAEIAKAEAEIFARRAEVADLHTRLIEASSQAQQTEEMLRAFIDNVPAVITMRDASGRLVLHNRQFEKKFHPPEDSGAQPLQDSVMTTEFSAWVAALEARVIATGEVISLETDVPAPDGTTSAYELTKFPLRNAAGEVYAVGSIATEVTEARKAHAALAASEERFRQMADNVDEVYLLWEEGTLNALYVSPASKRILGLDADKFDDLLDLAARLEIVHPDDRDMFAGSRKPVKEFRITGPNGDVRWIRSRTSMIETPEGVPNRGVTTLVDFTDQKVAELAAHEARVDAEAANRAKSEFLSRMSHELRTPLNVILGFGQLLEMGELHEEQSDGVAYILGAGRHLLELVNSVLDITGAETGNLRVSLEPVSVRDVTDEAVGMIRPLADLRRLRIVVDAGAADTYVAADRQRLRQVLLNLLANAVKYNHEGGEVRLECTELKKPGRVRITVSDTGPGIGEDAQTRLFRPFERLTAEQSEVEGSGLGLALAQQLVSAMSGQIGVTSQLGEGSSFWIELPTTTAPTDPPFRSPRSVDRPPPTPTSDKIVLYIEDNPSNVRLVERLVERRPGVELFVAMRGELGLELAKEVRPHLILLDLHLPDMGGEDVLRGLRADPRSAKTPIIVLTADASPTGPELLRAAGATGFLTKPFDAQHLLAVIDAASQEPSPRG